MCSSWAAGARIWKVNILIKVAEYNNGQRFVGNGCVERIQVYVDDNGVGNLWHYEARVIARVQGFQKVGVDNVQVNIVHNVHICIFAWFQDCLQWWFVNSEGSQDRPCFPASGIMRRRQLPESRNLKSLSSGVKIKVEPLCNCIASSNHKGFKKMGKCKNSLNAAIPYGRYLIISSNPTRIIAVNNVCFVTRTRFIWEYINSGLETMLRTNCLSKGLRK